jgi:hypothetical protein
MSAPISLYALYLEYHIFVFLEIGVTMLHHIYDEREVEEGVFIPISTWNEINKKYNIEENYGSEEIPDWQKERVLDIVRRYRAGEAKTVSGAESIRVLKEKLKRGV